MKNLLTGLAILILLMPLVSNSLISPVFAAEDEYLGNVYLEGEFMDKDIIKLDIKISDLSEGIIGGAFQLNYSNNDVNFLRYDPGNFFEQGGDPFYLVKNDSGTVFVGSTLRRHDTFPKADGTFLTFYFQIINGETFNFSFQNGVLSTLKEVRQDLEKIVWENLLMNRGDGDKVVYSSLDTVNYQSNVSKFEFLSSFRLIIFILSTLSGVLLILFLKKRDEKRARSSVNFK